MLIGADCSVATEPVAELAPNWNLVQVSPLRNRRNHQVPLFCIQYQNRGLPGNLPGNRKVPGLMPGNRKVPGLMPGWGFLLLLFPWARETLLLLPQLPSC